MPPARRGALLTDAARVARYFGPRLASLVHEELWLAALDTHGRVRETRLLARGIDDGLYVGAATVLRTAPAGSPAARSASHRGWQGGAVGLRVLGSTLDGKAG